MTELVFHRPTSDRLIQINGPFDIAAQCQDLIQQDTERVRAFFINDDRCIISHLNLLRPIYRETAYDGHFGRKGANFTWERTQRAGELRKACGL